MPRPFQSCPYTFTVVSMNITNTRSRGEDTDVISVSGAVGTNAQPNTNTKQLGNVDSGIYPIGVSAGVMVNSPDDGVVFNYLIANAGHADWNTLNADITQAGQALASAGAKAATAAVGAAVGASIGSGVVPVIGTALGALAGWAAGELTGLLTANCDGLVAAEQPAWKGIDLWNQTDATGSMGLTTYHPGTNSPDGCGGNSAYSVTWTIRREPISMYQ